MATYFYSYNPNEGFYNGKIWADRDEEAIRIAKSIHAGRLWKEKPFIITRSDGMKQIDTEQEVVYIASLG